VHSYSGVRVRLSFAILGGLTAAAIAFTAAWMLKPAPAAPHPVGAPDANVVVFYRLAPGAAELDRIVSMPWPQGNLPSAVFSQLYPDRGAWSQAGAAIEFSPQQVGGGPVQILGAFGCTREGCTRTDFSLLRPGTCRSLPADASCISLAVPAHELIAIAIHDPHFPRANPALGTPIGLLSLALAALNAPQHESAVVARR
jgi:hypothetical protein